MSVERIGWSWTHRCSARLRWLDPVVVACLAAIAVALYILMSYRAELRSDGGGLIIATVLPFGEGPAEAELQRRRQRSEAAVRHLAMALFADDAEVVWSGVAPDRSVVISGRLAWAVQASVELQIMVDEDPPIAGFNSTRISSRNWFWDPRDGSRAFNRAVHEHWPGDWHGR